MVTLDSQLENEYSGHLLSGKSLPIHFSTFTSSQVITSIDTHVNVSRSLTRLESIYVSLFKPSSAPSQNEVNYFWHPMSGVDYDRSKELEFQMQIGANLYPEMGIRSIAESFSQLKKALAVHSSNAQMSMVQRDYRSNKFVIGLGTENLAGSSFSGYNSKAGDL